MVVLQNNIDGFNRFISTFPNNTHSLEAIDRIFNLVNLQNNIAGFNWFVSTYPKNANSLEALKSIYRLAYEKSKEINTLESYNDFIMAYPFSKEASEATKRAYKVEADKYSSWFPSDEKNSRALLIQSKRMSRKMKSATNKAGYILVINRMNEMLQDKFPAEEATLRYLESEEFKDFVQVFQSTMNDIRKTIEKIEKNTSNLSSILTAQSKLMDNHFKYTAQEQKMADYYNKQFQDWERYLKPYGIH